MTAAKLQIPNGMQDTLPGECQARRALEDRFRRLFSGSGYREIGTPILEYYDALSDSTYGYRPEHVWKTFDSCGRVLALRPDSTIPAARLAAGPLRDAPLPLRLCYLQPASKYQSDTLSLLCEQPQAGVELMGEGGSLADAEVISLAVQCLDAAGLRDAQIELGHAGFFTGFMREAGLTEGQTREVRDLVERKDTLGIQLYLRANAVSEGVTERLMQLPRLYGGTDVLARAEALTADPECRAAVDRLREVIRLLRVFGCEAEVTIDLGMAQEAGYYSGIVFRGHAAGIGQPILSGGRYDGLPARFGRAVPAVGFALMTKLLMIALERQGVAFSTPAADWLVGAEPGREEAAVRRACALRAGGESAAVLYGASVTELEARLAAGDARQAVYLTAEGETRLPGKGRADS